MSDLLLICKYIYFIHLEKNTKSDVRKDFALTFFREAQDFVIGDDSEQ